MKDNLTSIQSGLHQDSNIENQPQGTYRFALNAINASTEGDRDYRSNEQGNEIFTQIPTDYIIISKAYMEEERVALLLVKNDNSTSEIGIFDITKETYTTHVNDANATVKLNFSKSSPIETIYRKRKGCEDTIYFVEKNNVPRYYVFQTPDNFKDSLGNWDATKFSLQPTYKKIPLWESITEVEGIGQVLPGSYNFGIQYLDHDFTPTEVINTSSPIRIYNDSVDNYYPLVKGSINSSNEALDFGPTNKAIEIKLSNLDTTYPMYRVVIICSNAGIGQINAVYYSDAISTNITTFIYDNLTVYEAGDINEVMQWQDIITSAGTIEQIDNRVILGNITGSTEELCSLQYYASQITTDCIYKTVTLNSLNDSANSKNSNFEFNGGYGYMPGENYSFGIVYIFEDNTLSPVYHIPGKRSEDAATVFSPEQDQHGNQIVFPMEVDNACQNVIYSNPDSCDKWGKDYKGFALNGQYVRHHRFPLRKDIGIDFIKEQEVNTETETLYFLRLNINGEILTPTPCPSATPDCGTDFKPIFTIRLSYKNNGEEHFFTHTINPNSLGVSTTGYLAISEMTQSQYHSNNNFTDIVIEIMGLDGEYYDISGFDMSTYFKTDTIAPSITSWIDSEEHEYTNMKYEGNLLGIKFSNVLKPSKDDTGKEVIGYYIVRQERKEADKTILDSGIVLPTFKDDPNSHKYTGIGLLKNDFGDLSEDKSIKGLLHLEHKFEGKEYSKVNIVEEQGQFKIPTGFHPASNNRSRYSMFTYNDVYDGTTYDEKTMSGNDSKNDDAGDPDGNPETWGLDGWSISCAVRDTYTSYSTSSPSGDILGSNISKIGYLDALDSDRDELTNKEVYNLSADNKIAFIKLKNNYNVPTGIFPYVYLKRENLDPYKDFQQRPYYMETDNPIYFNGNNSSEKKIFHGDTVISPLRYENTIFYQNRPAFRKMKISAWKIVLGIVLIAASIVLTVFTGVGGAATGALATTVLSTSVAIASVGFTLMSSGIKHELMAKAYGDAYKKGLSKTIKDAFFFAMHNPISHNNRNMANTNWHNPFFPLMFRYSQNTAYGKDGPSDDTIQYCTDCITNFWFDSTVNTNLRNAFVTSEVDGFLPAPWHKEFGQWATIWCEDVGSGAGKRHYIDSAVPRYPISKLEHHIDKKLLAFDGSRDDFRKLIGVPLGEYYHINPDYKRQNHTKPLFTLGEEYSCCSGCKEKFPTRVKYSEQSFQEEITDNYRKFLPNNYRDIQAETGDIVSIKAHGNNLYVFSTEAVYQMMRQQQQQVVDQVLTFIGTGEYFSQPPIKLLDDNTGMSAGLQHRWGIIKTPHGIFFVSAKEGQIYNISGQGLNSITIGTGLRTWFKNNIPVSYDEFYKNLTGNSYPFRDTTSTEYGTGFLLSYDSYNERLIITKKDFESSFINSSEVLLCDSSGEISIIQDYTDIINNRISAGWTYLGVKNCKLRFSKLDKSENTPTHTYIAEKEEELTMPSILFVIPKELAEVPTNYNSIITKLGDYVAYLEDDKGITDPKVFTVSTDEYGWLKGLDNVTADFGIHSVDRNGNLTSSDMTTVGNDVIINMLIYKDTNETYYHNNFVENTIAAYKAEFDADVSQFAGMCDFMTNTMGISFQVNYIPTIFDTDNIDESKLTIQQSYPAIFGLNISHQQIDNTNTPVIGYFTNDFKNSILSQTEYVDVLQDKTEIPYNTNSTPIIIMKNSDIEYVMDEIGDRVELFTREFFLTFNPDLYLDSHVIVYDEVPFTPIEGNLVETNRSWTISYDLLNKNFISWHSYLPNFYIHSYNKYFSWIVGNDNIWKHLSSDLYQNYYGTKYPFILELVSNSTPTIPRVTESIKMWTKAFDNTLNELQYVTFNKVLFYNSRQISDWIELVSKDNNTNIQDYLLQQVRGDNNNLALIDRNEGIWAINNFRDFRKDQFNPMFIYNLNSIQNDYYIDKIVNTNNIDKNKNWYELELFRDRYLAMRFFFDTFDNVKLLINLSSELENESIR